MVEESENQICSSSPCFSDASLLYVAALIPFLIWTCFLSSRFSPFLITFPVLILSTILLVKFTKKKRVAFQEENALSEPKRLLGFQELEEKPKSAPLETATQCDVAQESEVGLLQDPQVESPNLSSDSESSDESMTIENFDLAWICPNHVGQNGSIYDNSVSEDDEDSLIEIALPGGDSDDLIEEPKQKLQENLPSYLPDSVFTREQLMDLLTEINEVNEEENLIEIDISIGSIKCSRLEIEA